MNNEEKILAMLEKQGEAIAAMQSDISGMKGDISGMKGDIARVKEQLQDLDDRFVRAALIQENDIQPKIQVLFESVGTLKDKQKATPAEERVEDLESDMRIVKGAVSRLRQDVDELKKAQ